MDNEQFEAELRYRLALSLARSLRNRELVTAEEYRQMDAMLLQKYQPILGTLLAGKPLG